MIRQIFIGGSGRCGTTFLVDIMGKHQNIFSLPVEMRFITDPDGLINLADALTYNYSPYQSREALYRFRRLMMESFCTPLKSPYKGYDYPRMFGADYYFEQCETFFRQLYDYRFEGRSIFEINETDPESFRPIYGARYFADRKEFMAIAASFVDDLFSKLASSQGKRIWCEKTPFNILHAEFIWGLFPEAVIIHIIRDPRAVVSSLMHPASWWAPNDLRDASLFLKHFLQCCFDLQVRLAQRGQQLIEIKYEELLVSTEPIMKTLMDSLGLEFHFVAFPPVRTERADGWKKQLQPEQIGVINSVLEQEIVTLGYTL